MMKRIISCLLVCFLLLGLCPAALAAAGSPTATAAVTANAQGSATVVLTVKKTCFSSDNNNNNNNNNKHEQGRGDKDLYSRGYGKWLRAAGFHKNLRCL